MRLERVGFVGWRGMVGSVLLQRMRAEDDFSLIDEPRFFTTSQVGKASPAFANAPPLLDAHDLDALADLQVIVSTQGGDYTQAIHGKLRAAGWDGYWIDAASTLRLKEDSTIILDPVNGDLIRR